MEPRTNGNARICCSSKLAGYEVQAYGNVVEHVGVLPSQHVVYSPIFDDEIKEFSFELPSRVFPDTRSLVCGEPGASYLLLRNPGLLYIDATNSEPSKEDVSLGLDGINKAIGASSSVKHILEFIKIESSRSYRALNDLRLQIVVNGLVGQIGPLNSNGVFETKIKRIDVNDILVTREDGTKYWASGSYTIK